MLALAQTSEETVQLGGSHGAEDALEFKVVENNERENKTHVESSADVPGSGHDRNPASPCPADPVLIQLGLKGDDQAWKILQERYRDRLLNWLYSRLRRSTLLCSAEDICQLVWISLWSNDQRRLRSYDSRRASFFRFLTMRACNLISCRYQAAKRRREVPLERFSALPDHRGSDWFVNVAVEEILAMLSPRERQLMLHYLERATPTSSPDPISVANRWKLSQRVRDKVHAYFNAE